ncbi:hypothetical protein [Enterococcus rivorum]|uniref:hypothetical protein n=1 Tax=Enterococcus rivorum TaxID=762845 RepID=UPI0036302EA8
MAPHKIIKGPLTSAEMPMKSPISKKIFLVDASVSQQTKKRNNNSQCQTVFICDFFY